MLLVVAVLLMAAPGQASPPLPSPAERLVWVKFRDRGPLGEEDFATRSAVARAQLSKRSLARRAARAGTAKTFESDLPVHSGYVDELKSLGFRVRAISRWLNAASVIAPRARLTELENLPYVAGLEPVPRYRPRFTPDLEFPREAFQPSPSVSTTTDKTKPTRWQPASAQTPGEPSFYAGSHAQNRLIQTDGLHALGYTGQGVLVVVLDTGFRETHTVFNSLSVVARRDFINGDEVVSNQSGQDPTGFFNQESHGTYVLSILAGNWPGVHMGTAFGADVALGKTEYLPSETPVEMDYWQMGAEWADSLGADIISSSLGYYQFPNSPLDNYSYDDLDGQTTVVTLAAVEAARRGITVVTAQGNEGQTSWHWLIAPADGDSVCAVGSVDSLGGISGFSGFGPTVDGRVKPDICALGFQSQFASISSDSALIRGNGTSFSTPAAAGLVALLLEAHPTWGPAEVLEALRSTAHLYDMPHEQYGFGIARGSLAMNWTPGTVDSTPLAGRARLIFLGQHPRHKGPPQLQLFMGGSSGMARVRLYDVRGRRQATLFEADLPAGATRLVAWDGKDDHGSNLAAGVYLARFTAPGIGITRRMVLLTP